jgi:hypothetical protein
VTRRALACATLVLIGALGAEGRQSSGRAITRLDGTTIDAAALTTTDDYARFMTAVLRREGLREASWTEMFKLPLTIADTFTPLEWEQYVPYDRVKPGGR